MVSRLRWAKIRRTTGSPRSLSWDRDTLYPKYGIDFGLEYTHTSGVAQLHDYERFFTSFYVNGSRQGGCASTWASSRERRWSTILAAPSTCGTPATSSSLLTPTAGATRREALLRSCFGAARSIPIPTDSSVQTGAEQAKNWAETRDFKVIRNLVEYPRSWIVHSARATKSATNPSAASSKRNHARDPLRRGPDLEQRHAARLRPAQPCLGKPCRLGRTRPYLSGRTTGPSETVKVTYPNPQQAVLEVNLESPGLVILADVYYPGWELAIDGKPAPIYRVNGLMRGAAVSAGPHRLVYTYAPQSFRIGRLVSIAGLAALLILGLACVRWPVDPILGRDSLRRDQARKSYLSNKSQVVRNIIRWPLTASLEL